MKNSAPKKITNDTDKLLSWAQKNYIVGNFYQTRKLVHTALLDQGINSSQKMHGVQLLRLTSIDKLAISAGFLCIILTTVTALLVGY